MTADAMTVTNDAWLWLHSLQCEVGCRAAWLRWEPGATAHKVGALGPAAAHRFGASESLLACVGPSTIVHDDSCWNLVASTHGGEACSATSFSVPR